MTRNLARLVDPGEVFSSTDAWDVVNHMMDVHRFFCHADTVRASPDGNFRILEGTNLFNQSVRDQILPIVRRKALEREYNAFDSNIMCYRREVFGISLNKVNTKKIICLILYLAFILG